MTPRCVEASLSVGESMDGTAPESCAWIVLEHPGPWGARILQGTALPAPVADHLRSGKEAGVTTLLARRPETRAQRAGLHAWIARSTPGGLLLREGDLDSYEDVLSWDLSAIGRGELPPFGSVSTAPVHFVCTNGARDQCCAIEGRALVADLCTAAEASAPRSDVWECSHIGGHRFAPVMLTLPSGAVHGRVSAAQARSIIAQADRAEIPLEAYRGRSGLPSALQAVGIAARRRFDIRGIDDIDVLRVVGDRAVPMPAHTPLEAGEITCEVRHRDGRAWRTSVRQEPQGQLRPESCGKEPVIAHRWQVADFTPVPNWT